MKWLEEDTVEEENIETKDDIQTCYIIEAQESAETENKKNASEKESVTVSGKVGVNVGKTARKIAME